MFLHHYPPLVIEKNLNMKLKNIKMKRYKIALIFLLTIGLLSCKKEEQKNDKRFSLTGEINGLNSNLYFRHPDKEYKRGTPPDSIEVVNGKIHFSDTISELALIRAYTGYKTPNNKLYKKPADGNGYYPVKSMYLMFFAYPGADIKIQGEATDFMNAYPSGDDYNNSLAAINKIAFPNFNKSVNLMVQSTFENDSAKIDRLKKEADKISEIGRLERQKHIEDNPNSLGALWYLNDMIMRSQIADSLAIVLFKNVPKDLENNQFYKAIETRLTAVAATQEGATVPEINTTATLDGKSFNIESYRGKYVMIDFWGVWCGPCVAEMPKVKEFQKKYKDQLYILGINSGDTKEKMQNFLEEHDYNWQQIRSSKDDTSDNFVNRFNVKGFPTKFVIDPEGKIVKKYLGSGEEAFELLEKLLK